MRHRNDYKIRAFETGGQEVSRDETAQQVYPRTEEEAPPLREHIGPDGRPVWQIEAVAEIPKKRRLRHKKQRPPKPSREPHPAKKPRKKKSGPGPLDKLRGRFARKPKPPEVPPLDSGATTIPDILAPASG